MQRDRKYFFNIGYYFIVFYLSTMILFPSLFAIGKLLYRDKIESFLDSMYYINHLNIMTSSVLFYTFGGVLFFIIGYFYFDKNLSTLHVNKKVTNFFESTWTYKNMYITIWVLLFVVISYKMYGIYTLRYDVYYFYSSVIGNVKVAYFFSFNILNYILLFIVTFAYFKSRSENDKEWEKRFKIFFYILFIGMLVLSFNLKSRFLSIQIIFILIMVYNMYNKINLKKLIATLALFLLLIISIKPIINEYRSIGKISFDIESSITRIVSRVNQSHIVSQLFRYEYDHQLDKSELAKNINIIGYENRSGVGMTMPGYFYYDYKILGVTIGMLFVGLLYKVLYILFNRRYMIFVMLYILIFPFLINVFEQDVLSLLKKFSYYFLLSFSMHLFMMKGGILDLCSKIFVNTKFRLS